MSLTDVMSHLRLATFAEVALVLFLAAFFAVVAQLVLRGRTPEHDHLSRLPLEADGSAGSGTPAAGGPVDV